MTVKNEAAGRRLVYIASPYAGDVERNIGFARAACRHCIAWGHTPIAVHLLYPQMLDDGNPEERGIGLALGRHVLAKCDELWLCGSRISDGMETEITKAERLSVPIRKVGFLEIFMEGGTPKDMEAAVSPSGGMEAVMR